MVIESKDQCGYCVPCFEVDNIVVSVAFPDLTGPRGFPITTQAPVPGGDMLATVQVWKLDYSICLKEVKCVKNLKKPKRWRRGPVISREDGKDLILTEAIAPGGWQSVPDVGWPLSYWIRPQPGDTIFPFHLSDPEGIGGVPLYVFNFMFGDQACLTDECIANSSPKVCCKVPEGLIGKDCCGLLKGAIEQDKDKSSCIKGVHYFESQALTRRPGSGSPTNVLGLTMNSSYLKNDTLAALGSVIKERWLHIINTFSSDFYTDPLYNFYQSDDWQKCLACPEECEPR